MTHPIKKTFVTLTTLKTLTIRITHAPLAIHYLHTIKLTKMLQNIDTILESRRSLSIQMIEKTQKIDTILKNIFTTLKTLMTLTTRITHAPLAIHNLHTIKKIEMIQMLEIILEILLYKRVVKVLFSK